MRSSKPLSKLKKMACCDINYLQDNLRGKS